MITLSSKSQSLSSWPILLMLFSAIDNASVLFVNGLEFDVVGQPSSSSISTLQQVSYNCEVTNLWTSARHPNSYPYNAKWDTPIIASHLDIYDIWVPGAQATNGLEKYVETGSVNELIIELLDGGAATGDIKLGNDFETNDSPTTGSALPPFEVSLNHPLITSIMNLSPSPDWFTGFYDFVPHDPSTNTWYDSFSIETYPFDAGTETGQSFTTANQPESTHGPISRIESSQVFLNSEGTAILPVARWTCTLKEVAQTDNGSSTVSQNMVQSAPQDSSRNEPPATSSTDNNIAPASVPSIGTNEGTEDLERGSSEAAMITAEESSAYHVSIAWNMALLIGGYLMIVR